MHPYPLPTQSCVLRAFSFAASRLGDGFSPAQPSAAPPSRCQTNPISAPSPQPASSQQRRRISPLSTPPTKQNTAKRTQMAATPSHQWLSINGVPAIHRFRPEGRPEKNKRKSGQNRAKPGIGCGAGPRGKSRRCCKLMHGIAAAGKLPNEPYICNRRPINTLRAFRHRPALLETTGRRGA